MSNAQGPSVPMGTNKFSNAPPQDHGKRNCRATNRSGWSHQLGRLASAQKDKCSSPFSVDVDISSSYIFSILFNARLYYFDVGRTTKTTACALYIAYCIAFFCNSKFILVRIAIFIFCNFQLYRRKKE